ncbi:hypothetical protein [Streptomyces sp. NPDC089795]|uniref:hypothetical protein n=1 Tax=Streptomyces sp. NPDC089795 TaxID=3155297 RepID=UPI0034370EB3
MNNTLTVLASAAFGSTLYLVTLSTVSRLNELAPRARTVGLVAAVIALCAVVGTVASASPGVVLGFVVGAGLTPPVHRWITQRPRPVAGS